MRPKRNLCADCAMPLATCFCNLICKTSTITRVVLLQHPKEVTHSKNTGYFLHKCLINSRIYCGEVFNIDGELKRLLVEPNTSHILLYPPTSEAASLGIEEPKTYSIDEIQRLALKSEQKLTLWILDATWKKSRKMLYLNPWLQEMPRFCLENTPTSAYTIRKAESQYQLSSFEACCYALSQWETDFTVSALMSAFTQFIARIGQFRPTFEQTNQKEN